MSGISVKSGERLGLIYGPNGADWQMSHCQNPLSQRLTDTRHRVHFACRDRDNRSRGGWVEVETGEGGLTVMRAASKPSLDLGRLGAFDDSGAMPGSLIHGKDGRLLLYYTGWTLAQTVPFSFFIGLAQSDDGGETFQRVTEAPVLGRNAHDPFLTAAPWVIEEGGRFRMWYTSATEWRPGQDGDARPVHYYTVKHAVSANGVDWQTDRHLCLPYLDGEHAVARPVVTRTASEYHMVFTSRHLGETYRIYSATSSDGLHWTRNPEPLLDVSGAGWDSEMVCYGSWLEPQGGKILFYNGNGYGKHGFGGIRLG